jgi:hypothetical protein
MASKAARNGKKTPPDGDKRLSRDERVSFYPMDPEDVLKKLLRTPPPGRVQDKPTSDKGEK